MPEYKTPGVYIEEISTLPASVAPVETAIPAFIGYTKQAIKNGETIAANTPVRITSMLEYEEIFGGAFDEAFGLTIADPANPGEDDQVSITGGGALSPYLMYYQLKMYFDNGGGPCWIVSVGNYAATPTPASIVNTELEAGLAALEKEDEPTILVIPEAIHLTTVGQRQGVYDKMLAQCNKLQDRVAILEVVEGSSTTVQQDADNFRSGDVGLGNLKYGASYYPSLKTTLKRNYTEESVVINDTRTTPTYDTYSLKDMKEGTPQVVGRIRITSNADLTSADSLTIGTFTMTFVTDFALGGSEVGTASNLTTHINTVLVDPPFTAFRESGSDTVYIKANDEGDPATPIVFTYADGGTPGLELSPTSGVLERLAADSTNYNNAKAELDKFTMNLFPSGTMAGIYARVDRERGVWKAPANVSVVNAIEPNILVTASEQENLNVDVAAGKSINVIRYFAGKGTLVWGARTLAGNDNEWRYVPVRRFFNFVEESVKKATEFVVFEPNDKKTWVRVKGMIENFLTTQWRDGALAGAKPEDAFFVKVGLGETMTSLDILEGRMNVEIGMAAVRPAEFIILKFSHKLQES